MLSMFKKDIHEEEHCEETQDLTLHTHLTLNEKYSGKVEKLKDGFAEVHLDVVSDMYADEQHLIHNGFIFSSASYTAAAAVNEKYGFVIGSVVNFLTPVRDEDQIVFKAKSRQKIGRKRVVDVIGRVGDVKVFVGEFSVIVMEKHILNVKLDEIDVSEYSDDDDSDDDDLDD
jgi:acyl-coenzyme A thioesterase PaaI-like protein